jgi:hypothetical protein
MFFVMNRARIKGPAIKEPMILHDCMSIYRANEIKPVTSSPLRVPRYQRGLNKLTLAWTEPFPHSTSTRIKA